MHGTTSMALRQGSWIYLPKQGSGGKTVPEPAKPFGIPYARMGVRNSDVDETGKIRPDAPPEQLYDLAADPSQRQNRATAEPDRLKAMRERLKELTAPGPTRRP
jgi:arylsulfatase A